MTLFINWPFNYSGWTMTLKKIVVLLLVPLGACGTLIGNGIDPTSGVPNPIPSIITLDFNAPISEFQQSNFPSCGDFYETTSPAVLEAGRQCIRDALESCTEKKYLYDKRNTNGSRFTSFVSVEETDPGICRLRVHTVSDVQPGDIGDREEICTSIDDDEIPEVACGIGD
jgi:hypothetical protein